MPDQPHPSVITTHERRSRAGKLGNVAMRAKYSAKTRREWATRGGRPKDPTLADYRREGLLP